MKQSSIALACAMVCAFLVCAHPESTWAQSPKRAPCGLELHVHVVDLATHEPVAGATARVNGAVEAMSNEDGRFDVKGLCAGRLVLEVERDDYRVGRVTLDLSRETSLEIELEPLGETIVMNERAPAPETMSSTSVVSGAALERTRGQSFSAVLADVPGVAQLRGGSGIAKPIVRGQYGRRLLLLVDGVRHRAQDWGLDHAPEVDPFIAGEIAVVRGASGVRHGPDAIGGAVLVAPPAVPRVPGIGGELHVVGASNGLGGSVAGRVQGVNSRLPNLGVQLEGSLKRLQAPTTPDYALDNTGHSEWNLGATAALRDGADEYTVSYRHHQAKLGVCSCYQVESSDDFYAQLDRNRPIGSDLYNSEFEIERPYQSVGHDLALARGRWRTDIGKLAVTYAFQNDRRREYDVVRGATTGPQFDFRLWTHDVDASFEHRPVHFSEHLHLHGSWGLVGMAQVHSYAGLPLVPDHRAGATGIYVTERLSGDEFELEAGVRYDFLARTASLERNDFLRLVRSGQLGQDACGMFDDRAERAECVSRYHTISASLGALYRITPKWTAKAELSTASRPPNPDEQYINGTSPTFPVLGLGKPDLGAETTYSASVTTAFESARFTGELSGYGNYIADYIYFAPALDENGAPVFDTLIRGTFPRFVTRPVDAVFYGVDGGLAVAANSWLEFGGQVSFVRARNVSDDSPLVFVPADRLRGSARFTHGPLWGMKSAVASLAATYVRRQSNFDLAADLAPPPDGYVALEADLGIEKVLGDQTLTIALQGSNLLNTRYREYTSLLRYFVDQPGRQIMLRLSIHFGSSSTSS